MTDESEYSNRQLIEIVLRGYESKDLDYKGPIDWNEENKKASCRIVKDILAMANTGGGFLVFGVSEASAGFSWDGLSQDQSIRHHSIEQVCPELFGSTHQCASSKD
jgi:predicted HTH transcriptional regulator